MSTPDTLNPAGSGAERIATLWWVLLSMAAVVFVIVMAFIVVSALTKRRRVPGGWSDRRFILVGGLVIPFLIVTVVGVLSVLYTRTLNDTADASGAPLHVDVIGHRWWWEVRYRDSGFVAANELRVPVGRRVEVSITSVDVIHSFWVPQLAGKTDAIPGQPNHMAFDVSRPGVYWGECAEFCGVQHTKMAIPVVAMSGDDYAHWTATHPAPPTRRQPATDADRGQQARAGAQIFQEQSCAGCHTIDGTDAHGTIGPNLSDIGERQTVGAGALLNSEDHLAEWIRHTQTVKPGALMPTLDLSDDEVAKLAAYLTSLR